MSRLPLPAPTTQCERCVAVCCRLRVVLQPEDDIPEHLTVPLPNGGKAMDHDASGWCVALDRDSFRCTIHAIRPQVCRDFDEGGRDCRLERAAHPELARARDPL